MFRPWGLLDWTLNISSPKRWHVVGGLGSEVRSLAAWQWVRQLGAEASRSFLEITPIGPSRFYDTSLVRLEERRQQFLANGGRDQDIQQLPLLAELHRIDSFAQGMEQFQSVALDISSLPKRFFFPILRSLYRATTVRNLVITYTCPQAYHGCLSEEPGPWEHLVGFTGNSTGKELLIVGVGFYVESLQQSLSAIEEHKAIQLLIPFPAPLTAIRRSWESLYNLRADPRDPLKFENHRVGVTEMSAAFDRIVSICKDPDAVAAFAPFGPKPMSAAMCLYASQLNSAVYYPQPRRYNPDYSLGVGDVNGKRAVYAYWIKHDGQRLYDVPAP